MLLQRLIPHYSFPIRLLWACLSRHLQRGNDYQRSPVGHVVVSLDFEAHEGRACQAGSLVALTDAEQLRTRVWIWGALQEGDISTVHGCDNFNSAVRQTCLLPSFYSRRLFTLSPPLLPSRSVENAFPRFSSSQATAYVIHFVFLSPSSWYSLPHPASYLFSCLHWQC